MSPTSSYDYVYLCSNASLVTQLRLSPPTFWMSAMNAVLESAGWALTVSAMELVWLVISFTPLPLRESPRDAPSPTTVQARGGHLA
jgi:hypothetical protein